MSKTIIDSRLNVDNVGSKMAGMRKKVQYVCHASNCLSLKKGLKTKKYCENKCKQQAKNERIKLADMSKTKQKKHFTKLLRDINKQRKLYKLTKIYKL